MSRLATQHPDTQRPDRDHRNVAVVRGTITSAPRERTLPSGDTVTNLEVTTRIAAGACSVPVVVHDAAPPLGQGDEVVVIGRVVRRFFRAGGITQSRTELVATRVLRGSDRRGVGRALRRVADQLTT